MRYSELLEYKRDITATNLGKQLIDRLSKEPTIRGDVGSIVGDLLNPRFPDSTYNYTLETGVAAILKLFEDVDPTPNKQYTEWLVRRYIDGSIVRFEDVLSTWADLLNEFHRLKTRRLLPPELMDINKFKTEQDLKQLHTSVRDIFNSTDEKAEVQKGESTEILNNSEVRIIIPEDQKAACYYGQGTQWCTAAKNNNMFDEYHSDDSPLFILIPKEPTHPGEKYQIHIASESVDVMDETDSPLQLSSIINRFLHTDLEKVFTAHSVHASELIEFTPYESLVYGVKELQKIINQHKAYIINSENDLNGFDYPGASKKAIDDIIQTSPSDITDSVLLFMKSNSVGNGLPYEQGGFNMMMHEIKDGMAGWLRDEYVESEALHDFLYEHPTVSKLFRQIATKITNN
jgi:hypothetical protein